MRGGLLVADEDVLDTLLLEDGVVDVQRRPARVAEDVLDSLVLQRADEHFPTGEALGHRPLNSNKRNAQFYRVCPRTDRRGCA